MLGAPKELLKQGFNIVIDTALDGPDAKDLANLYLDHLKSYKVKFFVISCPTTERVKRLKTRQDNLFLTEEFIRKQTELYDFIELSKGFHDECFDSSLLGSKEIASRMIKYTN